MDKFPLGQIVTTIAIADHFNGDIFSTVGSDFIMGCLARHVSGDWGDLGKEDAKQNDLSVRNGYRLLSVYEIPVEFAVHTPDQKVWVITESDRSSTTVLFPSDY